MKVVFYLTKYETISDAVCLYLEIINKSLTGQYSFSVADKISETKKADIIVTYYVKDYFLARLSNPGKKIINWFQGVLPEESLMWQKSKIRYYIYNFMEWFALKTSTYNFFVSNAILDHYNRKYHYKGANYYIMPCFNADLATSFYFKKDPLSFVYVGSLSAWQCIQETLLVFKEINRVLPKSNLTILTAKQEDARKMIERMQIENVSVDYIPLKKLKSYLEAYKYGFLIREDIIVNRVATPNKLNTYMGSGVIPIYSDVIESFKIFLQDTAYKIAIPPKFEVQKAVEKIVEFEKGKQIDYNEMHQEYSEIFRRFYDKEFYVADIHQKLKAENIF